MRRLMWFTIGFAIACLVSVCRIWESSLWIPCFTAGTACFLVWWRYHQLSAGRIAAFLLFGLGVGFGWIGLQQTFYYDPLISYDGQTIPVSITADTFSEQSLYSMTFDGKAELNGKRYPVRVYLKEDREVAPGDLLESEYRLRLTVPKGLKESSYYQGEGIYLIASQKGEMY